MRKPMKDKVAESRSPPDHPDQMMGDRVAELTERGPLQFGKDADLIREAMDVVASCGSKVGVVETIEKDVLKLTRTSSPDGRRHSIPKSWVDRVDDRVHLGRTAADVIKDWKLSTGSRGLPPSAGKQG